MSIRFAINGVGRIGRALIRVASQRPGLDLVAVNDLASAEQLAVLLAHDSLHGEFPGEIGCAGEALSIDAGQSVSPLATRVTDCGRPFDPCPGQVRSVSPWTAARSDPLSVTT